MSTRYKKKVVHDNEQRETVLNNTLLMSKIGGYLDNPFKSLAQVNVRLRKIFLQIGPGPFLQDRLGVNEASQIIEYDSYTRMLFRVTPRSFLSDLISVLRVLNDEEDSSCKKVQSVIILATARFLIQFPGAQQKLEMAKIIFPFLLQKNKFDVAAKLSLAFPSMNFPISISCRNSIYLFFTELFSISTTSLQQHYPRLEILHFPGFFRFLLLAFVSHSTFEYLLSSLATRDKCLLVPKNVTQAIYEEIVNVLCTNHNSEDGRVVNVRLVSVFRWIQTHCTYYETDILFYQNLASIRYSPVSLSKEALQVLFPESYFSIPSYCENVCNVAFYAKHFETFVSIVDLIGLDRRVRINRKFKDHLSNNNPWKKEIFAHFDSRTVLKMFDYKMEAFFAALKDSGYEAYINIIEGLGLENLSVFLAAFKYFNEDFFAIDSVNARIKLPQQLYLRYLASFSSGCMIYLGIENCCSILKCCLEGIKQFFSYNVISLKIKLNSNLFLLLLQMESGAGLDLLQAIEGLQMYWSITASAFADLLEPSNEVAWRALHARRYHVMDKIVFNAVELAILIESVEKWTDMFCPLFDLDPKTQFDPVPDDDSHQKSIFFIDSALLGFVPISQFFKTTQNAFPIMPRLAHLLFQISTTERSSLSRFWARVNVQSFITHAPESVILNTINRTVAVTKWLYNHPSNDHKFNQRFASVFLSSGNSIVIRIESLNHLKVLNGYILPFLATLKDFIAAEITPYCDWYQIVKSLECKDDLTELIQLTSHSEILQAFDQNPQLMTEKAEIHDFLFDFDLLINFG